MDLHLVQVVATGMTVERNLNDVQDASGAFLNYVQVAGCRARFSGRRSSAVRARSGAAGNEQGGRGGAALQGCAGRGGAKAAVDVAAGRDGLSVDGT
jgi:hypothetical protein